MKTWTVAPETGRIDVKISQAGIDVSMADDATQRNYFTRCDLRDYATQIPSAGWPAVRKIIAEDFSPAERLAMEAYIGELLQRS